LTNRELIAIDQDPLGRPGRRVEQRGPLEVWARPLEGGRTAVALFNRGAAAASITTSLPALRIAGRVSARDVWAARPLGVLDGHVSAEVEPHGVALLVLAPSEEGAPTAAGGQ
jgi:alpha-galactosidase